MEILIKSRRVADYVSSKWQLQRAAGVAPAPVSENIGAILVDAVFQAGLNYRTVVFPRVLAVARAFPRMTSISALRTALESRDFSAAIAWRHAEKPKRLRELVYFLFRQGLETVYDLRRWLSTVRNRDLLRSVRGIGFKTVDYLSRLVGLSAIAVDRHAQRLLHEVGIESRGYVDAKRILEFAADLLQIDRWAFDKLMWEELSSAA